MHSKIGSTHKFCAGRWVSYLPRLLSAEIGISILYQSSLSCFFRRIQTFLPSRSENTLTAQRKRTTIKPGNDTQSAQLYRDTEAFLWGAAHGYSWIGQSTADYAAAVCVTLLGRNEGGLTLTKDTVGCVLKLLHRYFDDSPTADWITKWRARDPAKKVTPKIQLVVDMVIADTSEFDHFSLSASLCPSLSF